MTTYSDEVREEAALICAIAASNPDLSECYASVCDVIGIDVGGPAYELAHAAWAVVDGRDPDRPHNKIFPEIDAEAEALIRTGWTP